MRMCGCALCNGGHFNAQLLKSFEKRVKRGIHCEIPVFKSLMGNENYFKNMRCVVVSIV